MTHNQLATEAVWMLAELTGDINQADNFDNLGQILRNKLRWLFDYDRCTLALRCHKTGCYSLIELTYSAQPLHTDSDEKLLTLADNWLSRVLNESKPFFVDDLENLSPTISLPTDPSPGIAKAARSLMLVPLQWQGQTIGSLNFSSRQPQSYPTNWRNLASMLAVHLSAKLGMMTPPLAQQTPTLLDQARLEDRLAQAVIQEKLTLVYQPQIEANSQKLRGVEALLRWHDPELGAVSPVQFIPLAEKTGLIIPLGRWVLEQACQQAKLWQESGYKPLKVCVNVSAIQFEQSHFVESVRQVLIKTGLDPAWLELELTESVLIRDRQQAKYQLSRLRALGIEIALDDFGTGYSALSYLQEFPLDVLKIDQSFIRALGLSGETNLTRPNQNMIIQSIIGLAHGLNLKVVAEGVETETELNLLRGLNCDFIQGFFFHPPLDVPQLTALLEKAAQPPVKIRVVKLAV